jgi:hypothetical protein
MHRLSLLALLGTAAVALAAEPPARLGLEIGGTTIEVDAGQKFNLVVDGKSQAARIVELPTRRFDEGGIRFDYPRHFAWEHDPPSMWTLDGNNAVLILTRAERADGSTAADVLDGMADSLGGKRRATYRKVSLDTRQGRLEGLEATVDVRGFGSRNEAYVLERGDVFAVLILQDSSDGDAADAVEFKDLRARLAATLEF